MTMQLRYVAMAAWIILALGCDAKTRHQIQDKPNEPVPVLVDRKTDCPLFFGDGTLHATVRDTGAPGYVTVWAQQGNRKVSRETYLDEGETREVVVPLTGFSSGQYELNVRPGRE